MKNSFTILVLCCQYLLPIIVLPVVHSQVGPLLPLLLTPPILLLLSLLIIIIIHTTTKPSHHSRQLNFIQLHEASFSVYFKN